MTDLWPLDMLVGAVQALQEEIAARARQRLMCAPSCVPGCNHCCRWPIAISALEGLVLVDHLTHNRMWSKPLRDKVNAAAGRVTGLTYDVWRCANIPCPLLADNGMCLAWAARPISCRLAASVGLVEACHPHALSEAHGIVPMASDLIEFRVREGIMLKVHGIRAVTMPLPTAMMVADRVRRENLTTAQVDAALLIEYVRRAL